MDRQAIQQRQDLVIRLVGERCLRLEIRQLLLPVGPGSDGSLQP